MRIHFSHLSNIKTTTKPINILYVIVGYQLALNPLIYLSFSFFLWRTLQQICLSRFYRNNNKKITSNYLLCPVDKKLLNKKHILFNIIRLCFIIVIIIIITNLYTTMGRASTYGRKREYLILKLILTDKRELRFIYKYIF